MRQRKAESPLDKLKSQVLYYLDFSNSDGGKLTYQEIALLTDVSRRRITQLANELQKPPQEDEKA